MSSKMIRLNPLSTGDDVALALGVGAIGLAIWYFGFHKPAVAATTTSTTGASTSFTVVPGNMSLGALAIGPTITIALPAGAQWALNQGTPNSLGQNVQGTFPSSGSTPITFTYSGNGGGGTLAWTDASGAAQLTGVSFT